MNKDQFASALRLALGILSTWAITKGWGDASIWVDITSGVVLVGTAVWGFVTHSK